MPSYWVYYREGFNPETPTYMRAVDADDEAMIRANEHRLSTRGHPATITDIKPMTEQQSEQEIELFGRRLYLSPGSAAPC